MVMKAAYIMPSLAIPRRLGDWVRNLVLGQRLHRVKRIKASQRIVNQPTTLRPILTPTLLSNRDEILKCIILIFHLRIFWYSAECGGSKEVTG